MDLKDILKTVDHTLLTQTASWDDIKNLLDDAITFQTASVCIPPCYVKRAADYLNGRIRVCTVIGFPNGYQTVAVKCFETKQALLDGADEIDMVINIGFLKSGDFAEVEAEISAIKEVCGSHILKVIIETCLLTREEKIKMCEIVSNSGADFIKTSTGFSEKGATFEDVALMKEYVALGVKIKAAGGISTLEDAKKFLSLGAERLGTSRIVKLAKNEQASGY